MTADEPPDADGQSGGFAAVGEPLERVGGSPELGVRPTETEGFPEAHVAVHRPTGVAAWGSSRDEAMENVRRNVERYDDADRSGEIVETDGVLGGEPRVDGSRIGVLHVVDRYDATGSIVETAAGFVGLLTVGEVRTALEWADAHTEVLQHLRDERARFHERIRTRWERVPLDDESDTVVYRRPDDGSTFAILESEDSEGTGEVDE